MAYIITSVAAAENNHLFCATNIGMAAGMPLKEAYSISKRKTSSMAKMAAKAAIEKHRNGKRHRRRAKERGRRQSTHSKHEEHVGADVRAAGKRGYLAQKENRAKQ